MLRHALSVVLFTASAPLVLDRLPCAGIPTVAPLSTAVRVSVASFRVVGQELQARATLSPMAVSLNQQFVLNIEIVGSRRTDVDPTLPDLGSFARYLSQGSSTNMQVINGITTTSVTIQYRFQAIREGTFEIGAVEVETDGQVLRTEPVELTVSATTAGAGGGSGPDTGSGVNSDDLFIVAEVSERRVYENEPVEVSYRLFTRVNVNSVSIVGMGENEGFWVEEVPLPQGLQTEQIVQDGRQYTSAVVRRIVLFPAGPGTKTVEPLSIEASVRMQRQRRSIFDDFFGRSSLFGSQVPVMITSEAAEIQVVSLPVDGLPESFTGFVGRLDISTSIDRSTVETNDAVTLEVRIEGEGNIQGLAAPDLDIGQDFEVFPPEVTQTIDRREARIRGIKTYRYVLIPRAPGERTIPPIEMSYFDPDAGLYGSSVSEPLRLEVTGDAVVAIPGGRAGVETIREDIRFIRIGPPSLGITGGSLVGSTGFWVVALLPLVAILGSLALRHHWDRLEGDLAYARGRRAGRVARKRLRQARELILGGDEREFYAEVERALRGFLADKLNVSEAGFMSDAAESELLKRRVPEEVTDEYLACLGVCDKTRFAPPAASDEEKSVFFGRAAEAMTAVQEHLS